MTSIRFTASLIALSALAACASAPPKHMYASPQYVQAQKQQEAGADPAKIMICEQETVTGSHIPTRHCWTKLEMDVARERAQRSVQENVRSEAPQQ
jgi:hypothetical protein